METIRYNIYICEHYNMCRIVSNDIRTVYRKLSDGACITSLDVLLLEVERITQEVEKLGNKAVFTSCSMQ